MTDGPQLCALPGCDGLVEQPEDGGPRRLYCSPAHRAAARKMRHAARMDVAAPQPAASDVTRPIAQAPTDQQSEQPISEQPTTELPAPLGITRPEEPEPAPVPDHEWSPAAAWTVSPPTLPSPRTVRTITSQRVKKQKPARTAGERKNTVTQMRRRAIASVAIASLVAGGASYFVSENIIPTTPTPLPPQAANQPSMDADVWVDKAEVVLASLSSQLDAVAQAEASWLALPAQRRAQEPAALQALKERKALLEQQRATLMSQLEAFKALPERTSELTSAQAQLDAVERTLNESTSTAASPDYQEALRQLEAQREMRRQQRDHAAKALTDLRNGVEQALSAPLPAEKDETAPIVERVKAVVEGRPDPAEKDDDQEHKAADDQDPAATQRREDGDEERGDVGTTAPPDPERPNTPDILADGGGNSGSDNGSQEANGGDRPDGPVESVASALGSALGQGDTTNRDESANRREARANDSGTNGSDDDSAGNDDRGNNGGGLGDVVRGVTGGLLGGSDDDEADDRGESRGRSDARDDDRGGDRGDRDDDRSGWFSDRGDRDDDRDDDRSGWFSDRGDGDDDDRDDDRGSRSERDDDDDDDRGGLRDIADGLLGGDDRDDDGGDDDEHADEDSDRKKPSGKAERERQRENDREEREDRDSDASDDERADDDNDRKKPSGKAERQREKDREDREQREQREQREDEDDDKGDRDEDRGDKGGDKGGDKDGDKDDDKGDRGDNDRGDSDDDKGGSDKDDSDGGDDDGGKSDKGSDDGDSGGGDDD